VVFEHLRLAQLELLAGDGAAADVWLDRAEAGLADHPAAIQIRRAVRRTRARVRSLRGDAGAAAAQATALLPEFIATYGELAFDTDLVRVDLAEAQHALGQLDAARATLAPVIPRLAAAVEPDEVNRARAERVWRALEARR
jgi:hypothetical protein